MNWPWMWGVVAASVLMAAACTEDDAEGMDAGVDAGGGSDAGPSRATVVSDDGLATLFIPDGALPEGVTLDMISITALDPSELTFDDGRDPVGRIFAAYRLEPEGAVFAVPVTLTLQTSLEPDARAITVLHDSSSAIESPEPRATFDATGSRIELVSVDLAHFSIAVFIHTDVFLRETRVQPVDETLDLDAIPVGQMFAVIGGVLTNREAGQWNYNRTVTASWGANHPYRARLAFAPSRGVLSLVPAEDNLIEYEGAEEIVRGVKTLRCDRAGDFRVWLLAYVDGQFMVEDVASAPTSRLLGFDGRDVIEGRCVEGTPDAGPPPAPDAGSGTGCMYRHECGPARYCGGEMLCHDDSSSIPCTTDTDCSATRYPVCLDVEGTLRCADCRTAADCPTQPACVNNHCVDCDVDADCAATTGICGPGKTCIECATPADCGAYPGRPNCTSDGRCVQCTADADCTGVLPHCGTDGTCTECSDDTHCAAPLPVCRNGRCNRCQSSSDCPSNALPSCQHGGCNRCTSDFSCSSGYTCETGAYPGRICATGCTVDGDCDATRGEICIGGECRQCMVDADCPTAAPHCDSGNCYQCRVQADCPSPLLCDTANGRCIPCAASADCTSPGLPRCVFNACDGCISDADCTRFAGTVCNTVDGSCEAT